MLFDRREPSGSLERVRVWLWPRRSWWRSARYVFHRMRRLRSTPHAIALGCALGVFVSFTPFLGFHMIMAGALSWFSRASIVASALGTFAGNPITFPFIWVGAYELGAWAMGGVPHFQIADLSPELLHGSIDQVWSLMMPMAMGGATLGVIAATLTYFPVRKVVEVYQRRRQLRRMLADRETMRRREQGIRRNG